MLYDEKKLTDDSLENLGNLLSALEINKHFLANTLVAGDFIFIQMLINHLNSLLYSKFCNVFSKSVPKDKINKDIERAYNRIQDYYNGIEKVVRETPKTDD